MQGFNDFSVDFDLRQRFFVADGIPLALVVLLHEHIGANVLGGFFAGKAVGGIGAQVGDDFQRVAQHGFAVFGQQFAESVEIFRRVLGDLV